MSDQILYTALGWIVVIGASGAAYYYYQSANSNRRSFHGRTSRSHSASSDHEVRLSRARRRDDKRDTSDAPSSDGGSANGRVKKPKKPVASTGSRFQPLELNEPDENKEEDAEFAAELESRRKGTILASSNRQELRQRTMKQADVNKHVEPSATSSTTGAEADDDLSPAVSPSLNPSTLDSLPNSGDISDMLEPSRGGPSILNITASDKSQRPTPIKKQRSAPIQETKKQRQNRKKKEEQRLHQQEIEQDRKKLEEKQRRTAREARGEPAKNGVLSAIASAANPWKGTNHVTVEPAPTTNGSLLDTFAPDNVSTSSSGVPTSAASTSTGEVRWEDGLPDEDEQLRRIMEQDESAWHTVPVGGRRSKKKQTSTQHNGDRIDKESGDAKGDLAVQKSQTGPAKQ